MATDEQLVERTRAGELDAFDELYRRYERRLFGYVRRQVDSREAAEDLVHEIFVALLRDRSFDLRPGGFAPWLFRVARNRCINVASRAARQRALGATIEAAERARAAAAAAGHGDRDDPQRALERREQRDALDDALGALPSAQRDALLLKQVGQLTYREIAAIQGVAEGTVKSRMHEAVRAMRARLANGAVR